MEFKFTESTSVDKQLWTGMMPVKITHVNPTHSQLQEIYGDSAKSPVYVSEGVDNEGNKFKKIRLDFFIENKDHNFINKISLFLENRDKVSQSGNFQIINNKGKTLYVNDVNNIQYDWYDTTSVRKCKVGEESLYRLIIASINANTNDPDTNLVLSNLDAIFNGDVSELNDILQKYGKEIIVLLGVKDGLYQDVYKGYFNRGHITSTGNMEKYANDESYPWKSDFQNSMELQKYNKPTPSTDTEMSSDALDTNNLF